MATIAQHHLPHVSLVTDHEKKCVKILIAGEHGTLGLEAYAEDPCLTIPDRDRGPMKLYAICALTANGRLKGWFIEKKGATVRDDTKVFFPAPKPRKRPAKARSKKK
jgi:hypothetical protein